MQCGACSPLPSFQATVGSQYLLSCNETWVLWPRACVAHPKARFSQPFACCGVSPRRRCRVPGASKALLSFHWCVTMGSTLARSWVWSRVAPSCPLLGVFLWLLGKKRRERYTELFSLEYVVSCTGRNGIFSRSKTLSFSDIVQLLRGCSWKRWKWGRERLNVFYTLQMRQLERQKDMTRFPLSQTRIRKPRFLRFSLIRASCFRGCIPSPFIF